MPKNDFPMPTAKNLFQILNLHPKKHVFKKRQKKNMVLNEKITIFALAIPVTYSTLESGAKLKNSPDIYTHR